MNLYDLYKLSGPCGVVIIMVGILAVYLCARNYFYTSLIWKEFKRDFIGRATNEERCLKEYSGSNPFMLIIYQMVTLHQSHSDDWRSEVVYLFNRNFRRVINSLSILKMITVISPLLGLLGTVLGMLNVFDAISSVAAEDPRMLAHGIWQALITTVLGLVIAIPALVMYYTMSVRMKIFLMETLEHTYQALSSFNSVNRSVRVSETESDFDVELCHEN